MADEQEQDRDQEWSVVKIVESEEEATLAVGFLQANGVPAEVESLLVSELPTTVGHLGEVRVRVPADRLGEAETLLAEQDAEAGQTPAAPPVSSTGEPL
jgi:Putative prokaryotic signal transducing protein